MACTAPVLGIRGPDGVVRRPLAGEARPGIAGELELPCGRCLDCRIGRQREWALRCEHEAQMYRHPDGRTNACAVTLTYDEETCPSDYSVDVREWQLFAKRLRQKMWRAHRKAAGAGLKTKSLAKTFRGARYLAVGEYGGRFLRPHYHALLFGQDFTSDAVYQVDDNGNPFWESATLKELWPNGIHRVQALTPETVNYVCRYVVKKLVEKHIHENEERTDAITGETWTVQRPFMVMSRRPGIGATWFNKYGRDVFPRDRVVSKGKLLPVPRFYFSKLEERDATAAAEVKEERRKEKAKNWKNNTKERREARAKITAARLKEQASSRLD